MSETPQLTRQQLYEQVHAVGKEQYILGEMKRLGYWDEKAGVPQADLALMERKSVILKELSDIRAQQAQYANKEKLLREMRVARMKEALARREETKKRKAERKAAKAAAWQVSKSSDIVYLGEGVSGGLNEKATNSDKLRQLGLPVFASVSELAEAMGIGVGQLRFLSYHRKASTTTHYRRFQIPKKTGGVRNISAPMPRLKKAQHWLLENVLYKLTTHNAAHGFVPQRSILSNAQAHVGSNVVINIDLKDFFPTISFRRIKGLFAAMGYSEQIATIFALVCSEPVTDEVQIDGKTYYVARGERFLPQGAPTSPAITNLICFRLDHRFAGVAKKQGWTYTRYADDLTFSSRDGQNVNRILWQTRQIIDNEGFVVHPDKVQVMRKGSRQEVTGIVVNEKLNVQREHLRQFRAVLHRIRKQGNLDGVQFGNPGANPVQVIRGFANFVNMVNAEKGAKLKAEVEQLLTDFPALQNSLKSAHTTERRAFSELRKSADNVKKADTPKETAPAEKDSNSGGGENWWDFFA